MKPVTNYYPETKLWKSPYSTLRNLPETALSQPAGQDPALKNPQKDQVELAEPTSASLETKTQKLLDQLVKNFPGLSFEIVPDSEFLNLKDKAASLGHGKHLLLSESFLERMGSSEKDFETCRTILLSSVLLLSENHVSGVFLGEKQAVSWNIKDKEEPQDTKKETLAQMLESLKEAKDSKFKISTNVSYETGELYRKLARAGNKPLVQTVMSEAYQQIAALRLVSCLGDDKERAKAQKAIRSLQKLTLRSRQKIRHLDQETLLKLKKKRAIKRQEEAKARELQKELKKKQSRRLRRDRRIMEEGEAADREIRRLKAYLSQTGNTQLLSAALNGMIPAGDLSGQDTSSVSADQIEISQPTAF